MRASGILMPITSLASKYGIGTLGDAAYSFVDFLVKSGQQYWQILPLGPTGYGDSPYQSFSAFAANPYLIDLDILASKGLLKHSEIDDVDFGDAKKTVIDYEQLYKVRLEVLQKAADRILATDFLFCQFCDQNAYWLDEYAGFMAIKQQQNMVGLADWEENLRMRNPEALQDAIEQLQPQVFFYKALQYLFYDQWFALKKYANSRGIKIIGDIPIYVSPDSSDLWALPELFKLDASNRMLEVAGCPPDGFSADGQLWGNPLYDWDYHKQTDYAWWTQRMRHAGQVYDVVRIDHFRGFESYYAIPANDKTAVNGNWHKGPDMDFVNAIKENLPNIDIIAEDLGFLTKQVYEMLEKSKFPGMKVLQFAFDSKGKSDYLPHNYTKNSVVYTGTHDNTTTADWVQTTSKQDLAFAREYLNIKNDNDFVDVLVRTALSSVCDTAIIPMADWLLLGEQARINIPSTLGGNWIWRIFGDELTDNLAKHIFTYTKLYNRLGKI